MSPANTQDHSKRRVSYYFEPNVGEFSYGVRHHMRPQRAVLTDTLIRKYGLTRELKCHRPVHASIKELALYHDEEYLNFLRAPVKKPIQLYTQMKMKYNIKSDCPHFDGLFQHCQISTGGSISGAHKLNKGDADIAINWMGGLHHAKKDHASGFCYTNDAVLGIIELLKEHKRVLYVDIDVHHGDGVEEAFANCDRVMTVSFHQYDGLFFPGTGTLTDTGSGRGLNYALNVPLRRGITDESYRSIFQPVMAKVMERFQPEAVVLQCGADSLNEDRLGSFNMTLRGHGACVSFLRAYNVPLMLLGGGGYTPYNVARCWTYETGLALGKELPNELPRSEYDEHFSPCYSLHSIRPRDEPNENSGEYLRDVLETVMVNLGKLTVAPSVQMQPIPDDDELVHLCNDVSMLRRDTADPDVRLHHAIMDDVVRHEADYYDDEDGSDGGRNEHCADPRPTKRAKRSPIVSKREPQWSPIR